MVAEHRFDDPGQKKSGAQARLEALALYRLVEQAVVHAFSVPPGELRAPTRRAAPTARARQAAMYLTHVVAGLSLTETARLAGRDRTTAAHACRRIKDGRDDPDFERALNFLEAVLRAAFTGRHDEQGRPRLPQCAR